MRTIISLLFLLSIAGNAAADIDTLRSDGAVTHHKFEFTQNEDGSVRQFWATSGDAGETWATIWDGHYERTTR